MVFLAEIPLGLNNDARAREREIRGIYVPMLCLGVNIAQAPGFILMSNSVLDRLSHHAHHIMVDEGDTYRRKLSPRNNK